MSFDDSIIMEKHGSCLQADCPRIWVFGYGSLLWKPDFDYNSYQIGYIENYERRFNQGNVTFRGTKEKPGRVANLEKKKGGKVWGVAFEVVGREKVFNLLRALYVREIACGGYDIMTATLFPRNHSSLTCSSSLDNYPPCLSERTLNSLTDAESARESTKEFCLGKDTRLGCEMSAESRKVGHDSKFCSTYCDTCCTFEYQSKLKTLNRKECESSKENEISIEKSALFSNNRPDSVEGIQQKKHESFQTTMLTADVQSSSPDFPKDCSVPPHVKGADRVRKFSPHELDPGKEYRVDENSTTDVLVFTATRESEQYLGPDTTPDMVNQIVEARGSAGTCIEYVLRTSEFIQKWIPEDTDRYLFDLDSKIRSEIHRRRQCESLLSTLQPRRSTLLRALS